MNKGSGLEDHDSSGQRTVNCHMLSSRISRCVATTGRVVKRCWWKLQLRKFLVSYGKSFCFPHVVSPHPQGPPWWGILERYEFIHKGKKADKAVEMESEEILSKKKKERLRQEGEAELYRGKKHQLVLLHILYWDQDSWGVSPQQCSRKIIQHPHIQDNL